jgi:hypothetical protein
MDKTSPTDCRGNARGQYRINRWGRGAIEREDEYREK